MADKSFGVKELNLLNASGTPTITSPNNLNLNANNVAISTNVTIGGNLTVSNNIGISSLNVTGVSTFAGITTVSGDTLFTKQLSVSGVSTVNGISNLNGIVNIMSGLDLQTNGTLDIIGSSSSSGLDIQSNASVQIGQNGFPNNDYATFTNTGVNLKYNGSTKLATTNTGVTVTGTLAATAVTGDGSGLTGISAGISTSAWTVGHNGASNYVISGPGGLSSANNPDLYLVRGQTYQFIMNASGHGFGIQTVSGTWTGSNAYTTGITNAGAATGTITFQVPYTAPARLYYACTSQHSGMVGNIYLRGAGGDEANVGVTTFTGTIQVHESSSGSIDAIKVTNSTTGSNLNDGLSIGLQSDEDVFIHNYENTSMLFGTNDTTRLTIDSNGDLGLGIAAVPQDAGARTLHIHDSDSGNAARAAIRLTHGSSGSSASNGAFIGFDNNPDFYLYNQEDGNIRFGVDGSEGMRLTKNANGTKALYVNLTSEVSGANSHVVVNNSVAVVTGSTFRSMYMSGNGSVYWWNGTNQPYISTGGIFTNASDISLKKDITDLTYGIDVLKNLKPRKYKMKADDKEQIGFIAQEVETAVPEVVETSETPNGDQHKGLAYGNLTAVLTKALQEAVTKIETLEAKVAALESS